MPIGLKVKRALEHQAAKGVLPTFDSDGRKLCNICGVPQPEEWLRKHNVVYCSQRCRRLQWQAKHPKSYKKNCDDSVKHRKRKQARAKRMLERATSPYRLAHLLPTPPATALTAPEPAKLAAKPPVKPGLSDLTPPSSAELRAYIRAKYGEDAQSIIERMHKAAFELADVPWKIRIDCLRELLDRGWGKTTQAIAVAAVAPIFAIPDESDQGRMVPDLGNLRDEEPQPDVIEAELGPAEDDPDESDDPAFS